MGFYQDAFSLPFQQLIQQFDEDQKLISSICTGALPLAKSGILNNRPATTYNHSGKERQIQLANLGANVIEDQAIVIDGNVTTSWSPVTAMDVAIHLLEQLTSTENVYHIKKIMGFV